MKIAVSVLVVLGVFAPMTYANRPQAGLTGSSGKSRSVAKSQNQTTASPPRISGGVRAIPATDEAGARIQLVQLTDREARRTQRRPGFLRRMFQNLTEDSEPKIPDGVGEPPPRIPPPPKLTYATAGPGIGQRPHKKLMRNVSSTRNAASESRVPSIPNKAAAVNNLLPEIITPKKSMAPRALGSQFVNPFKDENAQAEPVFILDLDSIAVANSAEKTQAVAPQKLRADRTKTTQESRTPVIKPENQAASGFQLSDDLPNPSTARGLLKSPTAEARRNTTIPKAMPIEVSPVARQGQQAESNVDSRVRTEERYSQIPLLEEPKINMPARSTGHPKDRVSTTPGLKVSNNRLISTDTAEKFTLKDENAGVVSVQLDQPTSPSPTLSPSERTVRRNQQMNRIMSRTGKIGFKGFCPVALRDKRELVDSSRNYRAKFGLQTYFFSSPEAKARFEINPTRYAPAAGGSDVVLLVNTGEEEAGSLDFSMWYRDRLYLFRSRETRAIFADNPTRFANQY